MKQNPYLVTLVKAIIAGMFIAIGGTVFLSVENKNLGALLFAVGLFAICTQGYLLFTGKVCYVFDNDTFFAKQLPVIWLGNFIGTFLTARLLLLTRVAGISERAAGMCETKLAQSYLSAFILAIFCDIMIWLAVEGYKSIPHEFGKYLAIIFGVIVFILCGFEHCVANMFYFSMADMVTPEAVAFILVCTAGNAVGGVLLPLGKKFFS